MALTRTLPESRSFPSTVRLLLAQNLMQFMSAAFQVQKSNDVTSRQLIPQTLSCTWLKGLPKLEGASVTRDAWVRS